MLPFENACLLTQKKCKSEDEKQRFKQRRESNLNLEKEATVIVNICNRNRQ